MLFNILAIVVLSFYSIYALLDVMSLSKIQYIIRNLLLDLSRGIFYAGYYWVWSNIWKIAFKVIFSMYIYLTYQVLEYIIYLYWRRDD